MLVVDDERETADVFARLLREEYRVETAYGGKEALEKYNSDIDVVLLDRRMPDLHGDKVLEEIRSKQFDCRVVMVTAVDPDTDVIGMDFDDYLVKPVSGETLRDAVDRMLDRAALDAQFREALSLASKMATLESKMDIVDLENSEEYAALESRFAEYREFLKVLDTESDLYAQFSAVKLEGLFGDR